MKHYSSITQRYLKNQKKRSILTCIGIILSVALICAVGTLLVSFKQSSIDDAKKSVGNFHVVFKNIDYSKIQNIKTHIDTGKVGVVEGIGKSKIYEEKKQELEDSELPKYKYIDIAAYDKQALNLLPVTLIKGKLPAKDSEIAIEEWALDYLPKNTKVGDKVILNLGELFKKKGDSEEISGEEYKEGDKKEFILTGIIKSKYYSQYNSVAKAITFKTNYTGGKNCSAYVSVNDKKDIKEYVNEVKQSLNLSKEDMNKFKVEYNSYLLSLEGRSTDDNMNNSLKFIVIFIVSIIVVCTILVIYNIFQISVLERVKQFGILRSIGATPRQIRKIVFKEAAILSLISIPIGLFSGIFAMKILFIVIRKILGEMINVEFITVVSPKVLIISCVVAILTVFISAVRPASTASRVSPLEAIRNNVSTKKRKMKRVKSNFFVKKLFKIEGEIAYKNIKMNRKRFIVTIGSMVISIVLFIVFGSMMSFGENMQKFDNTSYQDYVLTKNAPKNKGFSDTDYLNIKNIQGISTVYKIFQNPGYSSEINKDKFNSEYLKAIDDKEKSKDLIKVNIEFKGYDAEELKLCKSKLINGKIDENVMNKEKGVLIVQNSIVYNNKAKKSALMNLTNLKVGDEIQIGGYEGDSNKKHKVKVLGILKESPLGIYIPHSGIYVITTDKVFKEIQNDKSFYSMNVLLGKDANRDSVTKVLKNLSKADKSISVIDAKEVESSMKKANLTMKIFLYGFVSVIALISCLNIINTISTNLMLRKREIAALEAIGMSNKQVKKMVYLEGVLYGIISAIVGSIIGCILSYVLAKMVNGIRGFEWSIPWQFITIASLGAMGIALVSSYFPLRRIRNQSIIDNIRMEE